MAKSLIKSNAYEQLDKTLEGIPKRKISEKEQQKIDDFMEALERRIQELNKKQTDSD